MRRQTLLASPGMFVHVAGRSGTYVLIKVDDLCGTAALLSRDGTGKIEGNIALSSIHPIKEQLRRGTHPASSAYAFEKL